MSIKSTFHSPDIGWLAITFEKEEIYLTDREYQAYQQATSRGIKVLHFSDGSLNIADIRIVEKIDKPLSRPIINWVDFGSPKEGLEAQEKIVLEYKPEETLEEQRKLLIERSKMVARGFTPKEITVVEQRKHITQQQFKDRKKALLEQAKGLGF